MPLTEIKDQQAEIINLKVIGEKIDGWYIGQHQGKFTVMYDVITTEGKSISLQPNRDLESKFARIPLGSYIRVTLGERSKIGESGNEYKRFKVECDDDQGVSWEANKSLYLKKQHQEEKEQML